MATQAENTQPTRQVQQAQQTVRRRTEARSGDATDNRAAVNRIARAWLLGALVAGIGVGLFVRFYGTHFEQLNTTDGVNAAQVARNVASGRGLKTNVVYPMHAALGDIGESRHDIAVGPLYAFSLGMFFKGRGAEDDAVALFNGLMLFATAGFLYALINLVYDKSIAIWAVLAYFISMKAISQALGAGGATIGGLMMTAALYFAMLAITNSERDPAEGLEDAEPSLKTRLRLFFRSPWPWTVAAGIAAGLAYLTGMVGVLALIAVVWLAARQPGRSRAALIAAGIAAVVLISPWVARNFKHFGAPAAPLHSYSLLMYTEQFPGRSFMWQTSGLPDSPALWAVTHPMTMVRKVAVGLTSFYGTMPELVNRYLFPFLLVGVFVAADGSRRRLLWGGVWFIVLAQVLTAALYDRDPDPLAVVTPVGTGLAVAGLIMLMRRHLTTRKVLLGTGVLAAIVIAWPYIASSAMTQSGPVSPSKPALDLLAAQLPNEAVVASDIPWQVAWYGGKRAVLLPENNQQLAAMASGGIEPDMIYLSRELRGSRVEKGREFWARILMTGEGVDELPTLGKAQMLPNGEALITLDHAKPMIEELQRRAQAAAAAAGGEQGEPTAEDSSAAGGAAASP